jgi:hypothetical protein
MDYIETIHPSELKLYSLRQIALKAFEEASKSTPEICGLQELTMDNVFEEIGNNADLLYHHPSLQYWLKLSNFIGLEANVNLEGTKDYYMPFNKDKLGIVVRSLTRKYIEFLRTGDQKAQQILENNFNNLHSKTELKCSLISFRYIKIRYQDKEQWVDDTIDYMEREAEKVLADISESEADLVRKAFGLKGHENVNITGRGILTSN